MTRSSAGLLPLFALLLVGCREKQPDPAAAPSAMPAASASSAKVVAPKPMTSASATVTEEGDVLLPIEARAQAPESPPSGWCGETAIQEGLLHLGVWAPQSIINRAGHPSHPDLYSPDIPVALAELGVRTTVYPAHGRGYEPFAKWIRESINEGDPVLAGVKILPTQHPEWGLDHFVLVVGYGKRGLLVNTTWGRREWVGDTTTPGLSFKNAFWAIRLRGVVLPPKALPARLAIVSEGESEVKLRVECKIPPTSLSHRIVRRSKINDPKAEWSEVVDTKEGRIEREVTAPANLPARFHCLSP